MNIRPGIRILVFVPLLLVAAPQVATADCAPEMVDRLERPADARGLTFTGTYVGRAKGPSVIWEVERVFQGDARPGPLSIPTASCMGYVFLIPGERYLFSTSGDGLATWRDSVAWSLLPEGGVALALWMGDGGPPYAPEATPDDYPRSVRNVTTLDEALDLVVGQLPPTDLRSDSESPADLAVVLIGVFLAAFWGSITGLR